MISALVSSSSAARRPSRRRLLACDSAKERAIARPIPVPAPVMAMDFPTVESAGRVGEMAG